MELQDYIVSGQYEKLSDGEPRLIGIDCSIDELLRLEPVTSEVYASEQYEVPVKVYSTDLTEVRTSIIATRSKRLLSEFVNQWQSDIGAILRVHCSGSGFRSTFTVQKVEVNNPKKKKR